MAHLLDKPKWKGVRHSDHVGQRVIQLTDALREALGKLRGRLGAEVEATTKRLAADPTWRKADATEREAILRKAGLTPPRELQVGTNEELRRELGMRNLQAWRSEIDAVPTRESRALAEGSKRLKKVTYMRVPLGTLDSAKAVDSWLAEHREKLVLSVREGPVIVE